MKKLRWFGKTYIGFLMAFFYLPIIVLIIFSFNESKSRAYFTGFTLDWYKKLFTNELILTSLLNTLIIALVSSVVATVIGTAAAIGMRSMNKWMRGVHLNFTYLPMINPEIVTGVSMMLLFVSFQRIFSWLAEVTGGLVNIPFSFGFVTLILAHITFNIPYVILNVSPKLRQMDQNVYDAARDLGCNEWQALYRVVIPDIMPGISAGFLTSITMSLDDFVISYFVSGPNSQTLPITIYSMMRKKVSPEANALSAIIFVVVLAVLILINLNDMRKEKTRKRTGGGSHVVA